MEMASNTLEPPHDRTGPSLRVILTRAFPLLDVLAIPLLLLRGVAQAFPSVTTQGHQFLLGECGESGL